MKSSDSRRQLEARLAKEQKRQQLRKSSARTREPRFPNDLAMGRQAGRSRRASYDQGKKGRILMISALCTALLFFSGYLVHQLYHIQVISHAAYAEKAAAQHFQKVAEQPRRGSILDRNGLELAGTTYVYRVGITPKDVRSITQNVDQETIADAFAKALNLDRAFVLEALGKTDQLYVQLKKEATRAEADELNAFRRDKNIGGVRVDAEAKRYYTNGQLASQVIGFTRPGDENLVGQLGIELQYNEILTGQPGYTYVETDNYGGRGELPFSAPTSLRAQNGHNIILNIDVNIQKIVQEELEKTIRLHDITQGGIAIVMDPYTGAILAMADYPYFSSEYPTEEPPVWAFEDWDDSLPETVEYLSGSVWRNRAISDGYRPGSTMKTLTAAMSFEEAEGREDEILNDAPMQVMGETITCHFKPGHGLQTVEQSFWLSCNPIFAQLSQRVGVDRFYQYVKAFGLRDITGIDLPAESTGLIHTRPTELDMATFSYGESATVTPLQMITAFSVFANGGHLVRPTLVRSITNDEGQVIRDLQPETIRKVISEATAARIRELLKGVVLYGTGSGAYVEGYSVAGKTSTSTYVEGISVTGEPTENPDDYYSLSFASIAPAENPEIVTLVVLHKPEDQKLSSGVAAKTNGSIVEQTLEYLGVAREYNDSDVSRLNAVTSAPDVTGLTFAQASRELSQRGFRAQAGDPAMGDGTLVKAQWPQPGTQLHDKSLIYLYPVEDPEEEMMVIPDFTGKTVHECIRSAADSGLNIRIVGNSLGLAVRQDPLPTFAEIDEQALLPPVASDDEHNEGSTTGNTEQANESDQTDDTETDEETDGPDRVTHLRKGSLVFIEFETIEEHVHTEDEQADEMPDDVDPDSDEQGVSDEDEQADTSGDSGSDADNN